MDPLDDAVTANLVQTSPGLTVNRGDPSEDRRRIAAAAQRNLRHLTEHGYTLDSHGVPEAPIMRNQPSPPALGPAVVVDTTL